MLKDIDFKKPSDIAIAVIPEKIDNESTWQAYMVNSGEEQLTSILINSRGYGEIEGQTFKTSQLRQYIEVLEPKSFIKIEEIREELLPLSNEFWISFSKNDYLFDKKYVFVAETLKEENLVPVPIMNKVGVLIK